MSQTPTVGRTVHYQPIDERQRPQAAIVVDVVPSEGPEAEFEENQAAVYLAIHSRSCLSHPGAPIRFDPNGAPGTWRWPPRV